jgi:hypothetical protein
MRVNFGVHLSACRQPGLSDTPDDPGMVLLYTISELSPQYLNKKSPPVGGGLISTREINQFHNIT